jgi:hypothetical protein
MNKYIDCGTKSSKSNVILSVEHKLPLLDPIATNIIIANNTTIINNIISNSEYYSGMKVSEKVNKVIK